MHSIDSDFQEKRPFLIARLESLHKAYSQDPAKLEREIKYVFPKYVDADDKDYENAAQRLINRVSAADTFNSVFLHKLKPLYNPARHEGQNPPQENGNLKEEKKLVHELPKEVHFVNKVQPKEERKVEDSISEQGTIVKELKILITISNSEFYDKVTKIQNDSEGKSVRYDFDLILKKALLYLRHFVNNDLAENYFKIDKIQKETLLFGIFKAKPQFSVKLFDIIILIA